MADGSTLLGELSRGRVLLGDGAMGTELQRMGLEPGACGEVWNLEHPDRVRRIHASYRRAGCDVLLTNTFGANRFRLERHGVAGQAAALNRAAARLAREALAAEAVLGRCFVLGDIGPFGGLLAPLGAAKPEAVYAAFLEQAKALVAGGVDALIVETETAVEEMQLAVSAARAAGAPAVIASFAFDRQKNGGYRTMMGVSPDGACAAMAAAGADVVGCNCGTDLAGRDYVEIVRQLRGSTSKPIIAQPNAGRPERGPDGSIVYRATPDEMAGLCAELVAAGAAIVGGCCGTTPRHMAAFRQRLSRDR